MTEKSKESRNREVRVGVLGVRMPRHFLPGSDEGVAGTVVTLADEYTKNADHNDDCDCTGESQTCIVCRVARWVKEAKKIG